MSRLLTGLLVCALFATVVSAQDHIRHKAYYYDLSSNKTLSKSQTMDPVFTVAVPNGFPRSGVAGFEIDYNIWFVADNGTENIDYFAFSAPSGWTITAIGSAPASSAAACTDGDPHSAVISGFSTTSAYWGGDYGGGVVTPGTPGTYPDINNRSGCGPFDTATDSATADGAGLMHTFSVTMTPSASGVCPGSTSNALPLCCSSAEVSAGGPPPSGSEAYFNEMIAASDTNATVYGDGYYYVALSCPSPFLGLLKYPFDATISTSDCLFALPVPDTLQIPSPPADSAQSCFYVENISNQIADSWFHTTCDSLTIIDDVLGTVAAQSYTLTPGDFYLAVGDSVEAPAVDECARNIGVADCTTGEGSDWVGGVGIQTGIAKTGFSQPDSAWICTVASLPVELSHFGAKADGADLVLEWRTASETNNAGFAVEHRLADEAVFREVDFVKGAGTSYETRTYSYRIPDPGPGRHAVRLKQIDLDGAATYSSVLMVEVEVPGDYYLTAAYPNPFSSNATVEFAVPSAQDVRLELVDLQGRPVAALFEGELGANARRKVTIDASMLASGTYLVRMEGATFRASQTVTVAR